VRQRPIAAAQAQASVLCFWSSRVSPERQLGSLPSLLLSTQGSALSTAVTAMLLALKPPRSGKRG